MAAQMEPVRIDTVEGTITCDVSQYDTGKQLFDKITCCIGLQEFWYFGLQYVNKDGVKLWLHMRKKVVDHEFRAKPINLELRVRFYPPDPRHDIIQDLTLKYFYREAKQGVEDGALYCPAEEALVISSLAAQARYGNYDKKIHRRGYLFQNKQQWLPRRLQGLYQLSKGDWEKIITVLYELRKDITPEDACLEYLSVVSDLYDYSMQYFPVSMKNGVRWIMGISPFGLTFYPQEENERFLPATVFHWGEITDFSTSLVNEIFLGIKRQKEAVSLTVPTLAIAKHLIRLCLGICNLVLRCRNPPQEVEYMRNRKQREREQAREEQAAESQNQDHYPSMYLYGRGRHRRKEKKKINSLKEDDLKKQESTRLKHIQKQLHEYTKDMEKGEKYIREAEAVADKKRQKATSSYTDWVNCEKELRGAESPVYSLPFDSWVTPGYNMTDKHWIFETTNKKLKAHCMKKYTLAAKDRDELVAALTQVRQVKDRASAMTSPDHLHIDDGSAKLDEADPHMVADIPVFPDGLNPFPWEDKESHEDSDLHIQQDLQSTQAMLIKIAQRIMEDDIDTSFKDQTQGFSKYRILRLFTEIPLEDRIQVLEKGEDVDNDTAETPSAGQEPKRYEFGLLGKRLASKQGFFSHQGDMAGGERSAAKMHLPQSAPGKNSYDLTDYVEDL